MTLRKHTIDGKLKEKGPVKRKVGSGRSPLLCNGHSLVLISAALHNMSSLAIDTRAQSVEWLLVYINMMTVAEITGSQNDISDILVINRNNYT